MAKILRQNVGGVDYTIAGCALNGTCSTSAADYVKLVTLTDGDFPSDGMLVVIVFDNKNTAGTAPESITLYSSDQEVYYSDQEMTQVYTLAPEGCYQLEYTGVGNEYTYMSYPVLKIGDVSAPVCGVDGSYMGGDIWDDGNTILFIYVNGKFILLGGRDDAVDVVEDGNMRAVTSNAVYDFVSQAITQVLNTSY